MRKKTNNNAISDIKTKEKTAIFPKICSFQGPSETRQLPKRCLPPS